MPVGFVFQRQMMLVLSILNLGTMLILAEEAHLLSGLDSIEAV